MRDCERLLLAGLMPEDRAMVEGEMAKRRSDGFTYSAFQGHRLSGLIHAPLWLPGEEATAPKGALFHLEEED